MLIQTYVIIDSIVYSFANFRDGFRYYDVRKLVRYSIYNSNYPFVMDDVLGSSYKSVFLCHHILESVI